MRTYRGATVLIGLLVIAVTAAFERATAQSTVVVAGGFTPANQVLFATNFSQDPIGSFPGGLRHVKGPLEVVTYNSVPMLRAIGPAEFLIPLSAPLPRRPRARRGRAGQFSRAGRPVSCRLQSCSHHR